MFNEKPWYKIMFWLIKKMFLGSLISIVNASNYKKCVLLSNQKCASFNLPLLIYILINTIKNYLYPFAVKLDRSVGSCNTLNDLTNKVCVPDKTEY